MSQAKLDMIPRLPRRYDWIEHPITGMQYAFGDEVTEIVLQAIERGYLAVPYAENPHAVRLSNTYYEQCASHQIPFVRIEIEGNGRGQVFWNLDTGPGGAIAPAPFALLAQELTQYALSIPIEEQGRIQVKDKHYTWYIEPTYGTVAFPDGRWDVVDLVLGYVREHCAQAWRLLAPVNEEGAA